LHNAFPVMPELLKNLESATVTNLQYDERSLLHSYNGIYAASEYRESQYVAYNSTAAARKLKLACDFILNNFVYIFVNM